MRKQIDITVDRLARSCLATRADLEGCSQHQIEAIEEAHGTAFPSTYREFLSSIGQSAGTFLRGTDFLYRDLSTLRTQAERLLREYNVALRLAPGDFVFAVHQGYQFLFFACGTNPDPPIFIYEEGASDYRQVAESFSSWFDGCVQDEIAAEERLR